MHTVLCDDHSYTPSKIICVGRNYVEHIHELGNEIPSSMVLFNKPNSAITDRLRFVSEKTRFEGEICLLIIGGEIAGVGFGLDLTKADIQEHLKSKGLPWERAKGFDGSCVLGRFVSLEGGFEELSMTLHINGVLAQKATCELMIYKPAMILEEIKGFMSLEDGDIIMSGTPKGVNTYSVGDRFVGRIYSDDRLLVESAWVVG